MSKKTNNLRLLIIAGGTGGHLYPALTIAQKLKENNFAVTLVIRNYKVDIDIVKNFDFAFYTIPASGFFGKKIGLKLMSVLNIFMSFLIFPRILIKTKPHALIATGGYTSITALIWALILKKKFFLIEQNTIPGRVIKYFSNYAQEIYLGFPLIKPLKARIFYTGNPVRNQIICAAKKLTEDSKNFTPKNILIIGGSQGSQFLNLVAAGLIAELPNFNFIVLSGRNNFENIKYLITSKNAIAINYTHYPEKLYKWAQVVITRAGALALSEILVFGLPSIIIPLPSSTDNHQVANAQFIAQNKAGVIVLERPLSELPQFINELKKFLLRLFENQDTIKTMSTNARKLAQLDATEKIAYRIVKLTCMKIH
jgi:UDP-N-acetylglucosamine--N-acetylmuramyl-(pentapeptide) pyrophosphoryl-undecaprenol N-acetylglucosamine transferase